MFSNRGVRFMKSFSEALRLCHHNSGDSFNLHGLHIIKTLEKVVDPFTKVCIETPMHVKILPLNSDIHPNGSKLIMSLFSDKDEGISEFSIKPSVKSVEVVGIKKKASSDAVCVIQAPIQASFDIQGIGVSNISIEGMHSENCNLKTNTGSVKLSNMKGKSIKVNSDEGSVFCKGTLQAENIDIRTGAQANVWCEHIRSNVFKVNTLEGQISVLSCYSDESHFTSVMGSLKLLNIHKKCNVEILERGDLVMSGFDGTLSAILKRGNVDLHASRLLGKNNIFIHDVGTVNIKVPQTFTDMCLIGIIARKLDVDEDILRHGIMSQDKLHKKFRYGEDKLNENVNELVVDCRNGSVNVAMSSWIRMIQQQKSKSNGVNGK